MLKKSLDRKDLVVYNEVINSSIFGRLLVVFISEDANGQGKALCQLLDFNDTLKEFSTLDLSRVKTRVFKPKLVKGD